MIEPSAPNTWQDLQENVARILRECAVEAQVEKLIHTVRGDVTVDVWAHDPSATPAQTYIIECKRWSSRVPQTVIHAFRTVVGDSGANWGAVISASGFQAGAQAAAQYSNVRLLTWEEFESLFEARWIERYFVPSVSEAGDPLIEYTEPINSRIFRKADALPEEKRQQFRELRTKHAALGILALTFHGHHLGAFRPFIGDTPVTLRLPLKTTITEMSGAGSDLPGPVLDATSYRELLGALHLSIREALEDFDAIFGERA